MFETLQLIKGNKYKILFLDHFSSNHQEVLSSKDILIGKYVSKSDYYYYFESCTLISWDFNESKLIAEKHNFYAMLRTGIIESSEFRKDVNEFLEENQEDSLYDTLIDQFPNEIDDSNTNEIYLWDSPSIDTKKTRYVKLLP